MRFFILFLVLFGSAYATLSGGNNDVRFSKLIVGYWSYEDSFEDVTLYGEYWYKNDGTKEGIMKICHLSNECKIEHFTSTWEIKGGYLYSIVQSSTSDYLLKGTSLKDRIIEISDKEMILFSENGEEKNIRISTPKLFPFR